MTWVSVTDSSGINYQINLEQVIRIGWGADEVVNVVFTDGVKIELNDAAEIQKVIDAIELTAPGHGH